MRITRLFIDNYKCFVGFDFKPQAVQPIFGLNGTGKSALFEVLAALKRAMVEGVNVNECFPWSSTTRWSDESSLKLILEADGERGHFTYALSLASDPTKQQTWISDETLMFGSRLLLSSRGTEAVLTPESGGESLKVLTDRTRSALSSINPRPDTKALVEFREWLGNLQIVSLSPALLRVSLAERQNQQLEIGGQNFAAWLRHIALTQLPAMGELNNDLRGVIDGFESLQFTPTGNVYVLQVQMRQGVNKRRVHYNFHELSDGQRMLITLYAVYHGLKGTNGVLCMDEPANYLALAEIQPYLLRLRDAVGDGLAQLFVVTHNPEAINDLAPDHPVLFTRGDDGAVKILPFPETNPEGLSAAELVARGWEQP
jgi:predicted ATPase